MGFTLVAVRVAVVAAKAKPGVASAKVAQTSAAASASFTILEPVSMPMTRGAWRRASSAMAASNPMTGLFVAALAAGAAAAM